MLCCPYNVNISRSCNKEYTGLGIFVHYGCLSCPYMYTVVMTRKLSYRKDDRAMRPKNGCPEKFRESLIPAVIKNHRGNDSREWGCCLK